MKQKIALVSILVITTLIGAVAGDAQAQRRTKIRYALGDVISIDELPLLIAAEQAKQRGVDVEITAFKNEDVATQAVINGQADVGQGTPYAAIQKLTVPIRFFYQLNALQFFPVVSKEHYKNWKDLDGQEIANSLRRAAKLGDQGGGEGGKLLLVLGVNFPAFSACQCK